MDCWEHCWYFFVSATELGRFTFWSLFHPLYSRLTRKDVEKHDTRILIIAYISGNPGVHFNRIKDDLKLANGTFSYHIRVLLRERKIKTRRDGMRLRFFPYRYTVSQVEEYQGITEREERYLLYLQDLSTATPSELAEQFSVTPQAVYQILKRLNSKGLVFYKKDAVLSRQAITLTEKGHKAVQRIQSAERKNQES